MPLLGNTVLVKPSPCLFLADSAFAGRLRALELPGNAWHEKRLYFADETRINPQHKAPTLTGYYTNSHEHLQRGSVCILASFSLIQISSFDLLSISLNPWLLDVLWLWSVSFFTLPNTHTLRKVNTGEDTTEVMGKKPWTRRSIPTRFQTNSTSPAPQLAKTVACGATIG